MFRIAECWCYTATTFLRGVIAYQILKGVLRFVLYKAKPVKGKAMKHAILFSLLITVVLVHLSIEASRKQDTPSSSSQPQKKRTLEEAYPAIAEFKRAITYRMAEFPSTKQEQYYFHNNIIDPFLRSSEFPSTNKFKMKKISKEGAESKYECLEYPSEPMIVPEYDSVTALNFFYATKTLELECFLAGFGFHYKLARFLQASNPPINTAEKIAFFKSLSSKREKCLSLIQKKLPDITFPGLIEAKKKKQSVQVKSL